LASPARRTPPFRLLPLALLPALLGGCYLLESARGQLALNAQRVPIATLLARPSTPAPLRARLELATRIRDFASRELGLPDNASYRSYADIGRPYVVWNVFAAPEFSLAPKTWCFPVAGCVAYRGYFSEARAHRFAHGLGRKGLDVAVDGVPAYSTLGHFADPVLSTMLAWDETEFAALLFHELAHQRLYLKGDTAFNEAFATVVEDEGVRRWLEAGARGAALAGFAARAARNARVVALLAAVRARLGRLYAEPLPPALMRERKAAEFEALRQAYRAERDTLGGYDRLFDSGLNNATLASIAAYQDCAPGFRAELAAAGGDLSRFYDAARALARLPAAERHARLCGLGAPLAAP
jgi:predicted aminopeptidase